MNMKQKRFHWLLYCFHILCCPCFHGIRAVSILGWLSFYCVLLLHPVSFLAGYCCVLMAENTGAANPPVDFSNSIMEYAGISSLTGSVAFDNGSWLLIVVLHAMCVLILLYSTTLSLFFINLKFSRQMALPSLPLSVEMLPLLLIWYSEMYIIFYFLNSIWYLWVPCWSLVLVNALLLHLVVLFKTWKLIIPLPLDLWEEIFTSLHLKPINLMSLQLYTYLLLLSLMLCCGTRD